LSPNGKGLSSKVETGNEAVPHDDVDDQQLTWSACEPFSAVAGDLAPAGYQLPKRSWEQPQLTLITV
jgi:hypothetical protein